MRNLGVMEVMAMSRLPSRLFCSVCGSEEQIMIHEMPNGCEFSHLGGCICLYCCRKCEFFDGCAEIQVRLGTILRGKYAKNKDFFTLSGRI
jgi:hypothetical protein